MREVHHPLLRRMSGLLKVGDDLILSRGGLFSPSDSSASLLFLLTSRDSIRSLPVTFADITTIGAPMPVRMSMPVRRADNKIYFSINLATAVVFYDLNTSEKSTTVLSLDVPAGMGDKSPDEFMTALLGDTEMLFDYHVIDGRLVTITRKTVEGTQRWFVSFLREDGAPEYVSEPIAEHVTWVTESEIMSIGPDTVSVDGGHILRSYPYSLPRR